MIDHEHMPPVSEFGEKWLSTRTLYVCVDGHPLFLTWEKAHALATAITEQLALERRP